MAPKQVAIGISAFLRTIRPRRPKFMVDAKRLLRLIEEADKKASVKAYAAELAKSLEESRRENQALRKIVRESGLATSTSGSKRGPKDKKKMKRIEEPKSVGAKDGENDEIVE
ncbi:unnamed protein product [Heligmosomoides polygyrus]|uniref:Histone H1 n=1 Tax=Heligmosomoides polygyrus TaxID=6339 RepID=A0A183FC06_HELPZ|nr:unnamed protein product [Heligmosomoides polygyrus]